ncbi:MAG: reductive dehalogenase domain-containing protein [Paracoccaceae bacterium]
MPDGPFSPKDIQRRAQDIRAHWSPDPEQIALRPDISGNAINGLNESEVRRPTPVYWQDPETIAHGAMQTWFGERDMIPEIDEIAARRQVILDQPIPDQVQDRTDRTPQTWRDEIDQIALSAGADQIGVAAFDPLWVYDTKTVPNHPTVILLVVEQDYDRMSEAPGQIAGAEVLTQYSRVLKAARHLAGYIRQHGWDAEAHGSPTPATFTMIPAAIAAGLGELGKHGSMIHERYGSNFRLGAVTTDLPLVPDTPREFGADTFCQSCRVCEHACPPQALSPDKHMVRGVTRWYVDFDKCQPFFNEHLGCSICTTICPWSQPGVAERLLPKMARRKANSSQD